MIEYSDAISTPSTQDVCVPLAELQSVDVVEYSDEGDRAPHQHREGIEELVDEAVSSHQLIIDNGESADHLRTLFEERPSTVSINSSDRLQVDAKAALHALQAFTDKDVSRYTSLMSSSNIETLKHALRGGYDAPSQHLHAVKISLEASDWSLKEKRDALHLIERLCTGHADMIATECDNLIKQFPTASQIHDDGVANLRRALTQLHAFPIALLPIRIDDMAAYVDNTLRQHFGRELELEYAGVDGLYRASKSKVHQLAHHQLTKASECGDMPVAIHHNTLSRRSEHPAIDSRNIPLRTLGTLTQDGGLPDTIALRMQKALVRSYTSTLSSAGLGYVGVVGEWCTAQSATALTVLGVVYGVRHILKSWTGCLGLFESSWNRGYSLIQSDTKQYADKVVRRGLMSDIELVYSVTQEYVKTQSEHIDDLQNEVDGVRKDFL